MSITRRLVPAVLLALSVAGTALAAAPASLEVREGYGGGVCLDLTLGATKVTDTICPAANDLAPRVATGEHSTAFYGAVTRRTARVDLVLSNGRTAKVKTTAERGARVYVTSVGGSPSIASVIARDANGKARSARDLNPIALPPLGRKVTFAHVRDQANRRVAFAGFAAKVLVRQPNHRKPALCISLSGGRALCVARPSKVDIRFSADCGSKTQLVYGVAPPYVRSATAVLAGGGTARVRVIRVPRSVGRPGVVLVQRFSARLAKRVDLYDGAGNRLSSTKLAGGCA